MKRLLCLFLALLITLCCGGIYGCGGNGKDDETPSQTPTTTPDKSDDFNENLNVEFIIG